MGIGANFAHLSTIHSDTQPIIVCLLLKPYAIEVLNTTHLFVIAEPLRQ